MSADHFNGSELRMRRLQWPHIAKLAAFWQQQHGLVVDGKIGPVTRASLDGTLKIDWHDKGTIVAVVEIAKPKPAPVIAIVPSAAPFQGGITIPRNRVQMGEVYGHPGKSKVDAKWEAANIIECHEKLGNRLPGVPRKWWVKLHRLVEPFAREALARALADAGDFEITRLGGFVFRHIRHDSKRPLSVHAFGAAMDINASHNKAKVFKLGEAPEPWSDEWKKLWPKPGAVTREFVAAMQSVGWTWGGDFNGDGRSDDHTFVDPMHFELVDRS